MNAATLPAVGTLGTAQRARFATDGYLAPLRVLSSAEAAAYRQRLEAQLGPDGLADTRLRNKPHLLLSWVSDLVQHPRVLDAVADLLGPDLLVFRSVFFVKAAADAGYISWHQDLAYWDLSSDQAVTAWIALTDSTTANGCVHVVPGSHRGGALPHRLRADGRNRLLRGQVADTPVDPRRVVAIELQAGEFSLHHAALLHSSPPNASAAMRAGLAVRYITPDLRPVGARQSATLVRGSDHYHHFDHEPRPRLDYDPVALQWHTRSLRRYGTQVVLQALRRPTPTNLRLIGRLMLRGDLLRAIVQRPLAPPTGSPQ